MRLGSLVVVINKDDSSSRQYLMASSHQSINNNRTKQPPANFFVPIKSSATGGGGGGGGGVAGIYSDYCDYEAAIAGTRSSEADGSAADKQRLTTIDKNGKWKDGSGLGGGGLGSASAGMNKRQHHRLVYKNGECNVTRANIKKRRQRYMADIFTTLVDIKWRWNLLNFVLAFILSWLIFALAWWLICFSHGDFNTPTTGAERDARKPCVEEVYDFTTALLFSIETQQTIGFGSRRTNPHCPEAILVMMCQSCFGVIIQALMTGLVFAKLSRPKKRAETLLFSKNAIVCKRDGQLCLLFRVGDMRKSHIVEAHVRAILIKKRTTQEGEVIPLYQYDLRLGDGESEGRLFMVWPVIVEHRINADSPLWELSAEDLHKEQFELVVVLEGIVESTGMTTQARTSYLPGEILWGHRFERLVSFQRETGQYLIDYSRFHSTVPIDIPQCSAKDMDEMHRSSGESSDAGEDDETISIRSDPVLTKTTTTAPHHGQAVVSRAAADENRRRLSIPALMRTNGINGVALAAFDLQNDEDVEQPTFKSIIDCNSLTIGADTYQFM